MNNKLCEYFLSGYKYDEKNYEEFNFRFNKKYSVEYFNIEFNKLISFTDSFYYSTNKLVTAINSYNIIIPKKILRHIIKLYSYALNNGLNIQRYIIGDFLLTYYKTIGINKKNTKEYKKEYKKAEEQYKKIMIEFKLEKFFKIFSSEEPEFYISTTTYGMKNNLYISPEVVLKMLNNTTDVVQKNQIVEQLLKNDKYHYILIDYDQKITKHKQIYLNYLKGNIEQNQKLNKINYILEILLRKDILTSNEIKDIINKYIIKTNNLCDKYKDKSESSIIALSDIESLKNSLTELLNMKISSEEFKIKIHECIINILSLKRFLLSDNDYINSDMQEFSSTVTIDKKEIEEFIKELEKDKYKLYTASTMDFDKSIERAIKFYSDFPLLESISSFSIDSKTQTYITKNDFSKKHDYSFVRYYENLGKKYTEENADKLLNIMKEGYYNEMLRDLSRTFIMHQNLTLNTLGKERFEMLINSIKIDLNYKSSNNYEIIVRNILATELNINIILTKNLIDYSNNPASNLDLLFEKFVDNKIARNGIMYLYYSLYERTGPNLRNKAAHGTLINEDLSIPLMISFSTLIFSSWLLNE